MCKRDDSHDTGDINNPPFCFLYQRQHHFCHLNCPPKIYVESSFHVFRRQPFDRSVLTNAYMYFLTRSWFMRNWILQSRKIKKLSDSLQKSKKQKNLFEVNTKLPKIANNKKLVWHFWPFKKGNF